MKNFTKETVYKVSNLAKIKLSDSDVERYSNDLTAILNEIKKLQDINTHGVEPTSNVSTGTTKTRLDEVNNDDNAKIVLSNSTHTQYNFFVVPKVIE